MVSPLAKISAVQRKMNVAPKSMRIDIDDIQTNDFNKAAIIDIEELAESIKKYGLQKPLEVYENDDGYYTLIGGERRYTAIKKIIDEDEDSIDPEIPCLVVPKPSKESTERLMIILSNAQREETEEGRIEIVKELLNILEDDPSIKEGFEGRTRDWIATFIGRKGRTVQKYLDIIDGKTPTKQEEVKQDTEDDISSTEKEERQEQEVDNFTKSIKSILSKCEISENDLIFDEDSQTVQITYNLNEKQLKKLIKVLNS